MVGILLPSWTSSYPESDELSPNVPHFTMFANLNFNEADSGVLKIVVGFEILFDSALSLWRNLSLEATSFFP